MKKRKEGGFSELATVIFILPILVYMIFTLLEVGFEVRYRMAVDTITREAVRGAALDGGNLPVASKNSLQLQGNKYFPLSNKGTGSTYYYDTGQGQVPINSYDGLGSARLDILCGLVVNGSNAGSDRCDASKGPPIMTCSPIKAAYIGDLITCTATFNYKPITSFASNPVASFGLSGFLTHPITVTETAAATVNGG
jgi:hypothetical protein